MRRLLSDRMIWLLAAVALLLGAIAFVQWRAAQGPVLPRAGAPGEDASVSVSVPAPPEFPELQAYQEIVERPLFTASRRPPPPEESAPVAAAKPPPQYQLEGTALGPEGAVLLLRDKRKRELRRVRRGETVDGWTVAEVGEGWAKLEQGERTVRLEIELPGEERAQPRTARSSGGRLRTAVGTGSR